MSADNIKHDFHLVDPSPWPIYVSFATLVLAFGAVYYFHSKALWLLLVGFALVIYGAFMWWRDVIEEAEHQGHHTPVVQIGHRYGMTLFIASEVMFFVAWFWAYFNASLFPSEAIGGAWPPPDIKTFDPWEGSYHIEKLTEEIATKAWKLINEIEDLGRMTKAIEKGIPKMRIEEAAAIKQAKIDSGQDVIVGVNKYALKEEDPIHTLEVDNEAVRNSQIERLNKLKENRNNTEVQKSLVALTQAAKSGNDNLLDLAIKAARNRATLGEISDALEVVFGRHKAVHKTISGVYSKEIKDDKLFSKAKKLADDFAVLEGRRPRIMIAKLGQDGHDRGAKVVATGYADLGFDVDIGPLFQTPQEATKQAVENDVHILGISSLAAGHKTLVPQVIEAL